MKLFKYLLKISFKGSFGEFKIFMQMSMSGNIAKSQSPLMLTDLGQEIAKDINATAIIDKNWDVIFKKIIEKGISDKSNLYDIQKCCFEIGNDYKEIVDDNNP